MNKGQFPRLENLYDGSESIFINSSVANSSEGIREIKTGVGFVGTLAVDLDGTSEDFFVKINNFVQDNKDHVTFDVYKNHISAILCSTVLNFKI